MSKAQNLQDLFLNQARKRSMPLTVFLMNGFQMRGTVVGFDSFTVVLESEGKQQLVYKHAISTVAPARQMSIPELDMEREEESQREMAVR
ncbi:MAG: RNA chaperone Hfq [Oscillospiraceae bacterium]